MNIGWERKIGYSFVGLMAGNGVNLILLLLIALLTKLDVFAQIQQFWNLDIRTALLLFMVFGMFSMLGWAVVGLPVMLALRTEVAADFHWITSALVGAALGILAMLLLFTALYQGRIDQIVHPSNPQEIRTFAGFFSDAALIAAVTFAVYCSQVKAALLRRSKENGAPSGTPRSLAWFNF